jgi:predicted ATPase with chaperone activity
MRSMTPIAELNDVAAGEGRPVAPRTLAETGLNKDLLLQLALKNLHFAGELTGTELANRMGLAFSVIEPAVDDLLVQRHCEIVGGTMIGRASYRYRITDAGRARATLFLESNLYVGMAPVPLEQYREYMTGVRRRRPQKVTREQIRNAFSHLVISDRVLDQIGPAVNSGHSMFVYGPPGNGKTVISQAVRKLLAGHLYIPHALEVQGNIIRFFDPVNHEPLPDSADDAASSSLDIGDQTDKRWVRCRRPMVMVGGELTLDALALSYNEVAGFYGAPVQALANGGVLVIDDFGRQQCAPRDLLNRWIVPLESGVDFLTLASGQKFEIPFMTLVVFATNIKPAELVDEAFLRRIHYKIFAESPTRLEFMKIFERCSGERDIEFDGEAVTHMLDNYYKPRGLQPRGCHPRDLIDQLISLADYMDAPRLMTSELLELACAAYFVDEREPSSNVA